MAHGAGPALYRTHHVFSWDQTLGALEKAEHEDVEYGGVYDAYSGAAITIWSRPWNTPEGRDAAEVVGTIYWDWGQPDDRCVDVFAIQVGRNATLGEVKRHMRALFGHPIMARVVA